MTTQRQRKNVSARRRKAKAVAKQHAVKFASMNAVASGSAVAITGVGVDKFGPDADITVAIRLSDGREVTVIRTVDGGGITSHWVTGAGLKKAVAFADRSPRKRKVEWTGE